ncbi:MAG: hypothetical protein J5833_07210 [Victivallales bacterium]|nr:hypothetical protein [Victivallales bacterium]
MDKYIKVIKENWEAAVLVAACVLAAISVVVFFWGGREEENITATSKQQLARQKALSDKAFAFLKPKAADCPRNPFELAVKKPEPPKPKPAPPKEPEKKVEAPVVAVEPVKEPEPPKEEPVAEVVAETPKPQPVLGTFEFVFQRRNSDGKTVAVVRTQLRGEALNGQTVGVGDVISGVRVLAISEDRIGLQDARGQRGTIPLGEKRNVIFCK